MRCSRHDFDAIAVCAYCGGALCSSCDRTDSRRRHICSDSCASFLVEADSVIRMTVERNESGMRACAAFLNIFAVGFSLLGVYFGYVRGWDVLAWMGLAMGMGMLMGSYLLRRSLHLSRPESTKPVEPTGDGRFLPSPDSSHHTTGNRPGGSLRR